LTARATSPKARRTQGKNEISFFGLDAEDANTAVTPSVDFNEFHFVFSTLSATVPIVFITHTAKSLENALIRGGFSVEKREYEGADPQARTEAKYENLLNTSLNPDEVAQMVGLSVNDVLRQLDEGVLYGISTDNGWRVPTFQFEGNRPLPGLDEVLPLLHQELHPIAVSNWFANPNPDLLIGGTAVSPRQWLLSRHNPTAAARLAIDL